MYYSIRCDFFYPFSMNLNTAFFFLFMVTGKYYSPRWWRDCMCAGLLLFHLSSGLPSIVTDDSSSETGFACQQWIVFTISSTSIRCLRVVWLFPWPKSKLINYISVVCPLTRYTIYAAYIPSKHRIDRAISPCAAHIMLLAPWVWSVPLPGLKPTCMCLTCAWVDHVHPSTVQ